MRIPGKGLLLALLTACSRPDLKSTMHLASGDSVRILRTQQLVRGGVPGLVLFYNPFMPITDTTRLKRIAVGVLQDLERRKVALPLWVVLCATSSDCQLRPTDTVYSKVFMHRPDGQWHFLSGQAAAARASGKMSVDTSR